MVRHGVVRRGSLPGGRRFLSLDVLAAALFFSAGALAFRMSCGLMPALYYSIFLRGGEREGRGALKYAWERIKEAERERGRGKERQRGGKKHGGISRAILRRERVSGWKVVDSQTLSQLHEMLSTLPPLFLFLLFTPSFQLTGKGHKIVRNLAYSLSGE